MKQTLYILLAMMLTVTASAQTFTFGEKRNPQGQTFEVDSRGIVINGHHVVPVMGEIHYARVPQCEWRRELRKMKAGGITIVSTYCFWIHHEEEQGLWDWSGNRDLHRFLEICQEEGLYVVLRIGPFCHGEVYHGGFPDWLVDKAEADPKNYKLRTLAPGFMAATQRLYSNIYAQASDMLWKNGGPVVGVQIENECRGPWPYYHALKDMAVKIGFDTPFYTRTGWPKLNGKEVFGEMLPLYGDYADGFWDRVLTDMPGEYSKAFVFKDTRLSGVIATETFGTDQDTKMEKAELNYPYFTCELGGGMMPSYHRRLNMTGNEPMPLVICKVGSGSNLPGYYMYHGGTNPRGKYHALSEMQASRATAHNDLPQMSYDFQCPLGEVGQLNEAAYHQTRWLHQMLADWGEELSQMDVDTLSEHHARRGSFVFRNDYVRMLNEEGVASVTPCGLTLADGVIVDDATVQPFAKTDEGYLFITIKNKRPVMTVNGKKHKMKLDVPMTVNGVRMTVLSPEKAKAAYVIDRKVYYAAHGGVLYKTPDGIVEDYWVDVPDHTVACTQTKEAAPARVVGKGKAGVAEQPAEKEWLSAACWTVDGITPADSSSVLAIAYNGDVARVYADGVLVNDNFWNGKEMMVRCADLIGKKVEIRILPLAKDAPIYLQHAQKELLRNAPASGLLELKGIRVVRNVIKAMP